MTNLRTLAQCYRAGELMAEGRDVRERYGLAPGDVIARFGAPGGPPPGYLVVWCEADEHYRWVMEGGDVWSDALPDKWTARRWAWAHERNVADKPVPGGRPGT